MSNTIRKAIRDHIQKMHPAEKWLPALAVMPLLAVVSVSDVMAQELAGQSGVTTLEEIVVTARRRSENLQDVPMTVNVVTAEVLDNLNIRRLEDIQAIVPGLTLAEDPIAANASMRGVRFDSFAGGAPTVEFYLNDAPILAGDALQAMFDIGQIEVLRGPQGTLRGRPAPSGSITLTTQRPDLAAFGGYLDATATNEGGRNLRGALNIPIVEDMLALRVAGLMEENQAGHIKSSHGRMSEVKTDGYRVSLGYEPIDSLSFNLMHQRIEPDRKIYPHVESANRKDPTQPDSPRSISPGDRRAVTDVASTARQQQDRTGLEVAWDLGDLRLNYAGQLSESSLERRSSGDDGDFYGPEFPDALQSLGQELSQRTREHSHELRLSYTQGNFDYVLGGLYHQFKSDINTLQKTPIFFGFANPGTLVLVNETPIATGGTSVEKSVFGNVTWRITDATELSGGLRHIRFSEENQVTVSGNVISAVDEDWGKTLYLASLKHDFSDTLMGYATVGTSWRQGITAIGNFNTRRSARENSFMTLSPETSTSYEVGFKSTWVDSRLRLNGALFYQDFKNYRYRSGGAGAGGSGVYFVTTDASGVASVGQFNFVAAVPAEVYGLELEAFFQATERWSVNGLFSWARGMVDNGTIPCNDYLPADGRQDAPGVIPSLGDIIAAVGDQNVAACQASFRASFAPLWTASLQSEYAFPLAGQEGYVRGQVSLYGDSKNDPNNDIDDVSAYGMVDLYAGMRSTDRKWEAMLFVKNVFDTEKVLGRSADPYSVGYQAITGTGVQGQTGVTTYRGISMTPPREIGVNLRYNF